MSERILEKVSGNVEFLLTPPESTVKHHCGEVGAVSAPSTTEITIRAVDASVHDRRLGL